MKIERVPEFAQKVLAATSSGKLAWEQRDSQYFAARVGKGFVTIHESSSDHSWEEPDYVIGFRNQRDDFIVSFADTDFRGIWPDAFKVLRSLYLEVRLEALGFDDLLKDMSNDLDAKDL